ncbi:phosphopantothenoylcysteine decarboxylase/phosphopantothenate--cysteine ligase [Motilibacter peucedani]|uniref:Coenzyme A biosynthesis bifunctional protein CoaBC n=1 Tax=Motilibacter peucedani TaxID=598650 RepID=A0A420XSD8_9ACTN|nr:bifunctional phosphopantothenoylcysteine decarboxylase/phosphopantothenate--cysteine ligase CoaBC [Motilibacter peucedani]RKS77784.1 phosphopantothenoylcysteine decarboxylase/phosphopantothenate--cysteine ligase [Motilibacter peucedani]
MSRIVLGVGGGIAAYKACELLRRLREAGHAVRVVPTAAALQFVGAPTWEALSGEPVATEVWSEVPEVLHVRLGREADLVVVAPATADLLARAAAGRADDLLTSTLLTARCPVVMAPAMHTEMWEHPATRANVATLRSRGVLVLDPGVGRLTGADSGPGRLPEPEQLAEACRVVLARGGLAHDLAGRHVVVSAGGTREPLDPVRFLGNRSSGRQGVALAATALARGARVTLVGASLAVPAPAGARLVRVTTAEQLGEAVLEAAADADAVVMAAAVADFRPVSTQGAKIKKSGTGAPELVLEQTVDVLAQLVAVRPAEQVVVGFAAETGDETGDALAHGRAKLARKGCDLLVVNEVGPAGHPSGFEGADNAAVVLAADGAEVVVPLGPKEALADVVWDLVVARLRR